ncbi:hypothetical protein HETIRDRAFT_446565 [Heterobasidion irregulare TC 32-1]|uniref:Uncharacterized protein n=1 Tax=Heterobasidion irregulare (strain TC 32-1) TaxID=747525 RepID=W4JTF4_HETIT|nr:uncharacterized protein HETIRDRAFT_446565 [Heterobasidion irregulare TC 32-1]ETW76744.1 hypothetical protein HETIRDRAFT_446565 [Heterobasidion irregulare TC 32-1]
MFPPSSTSSRYRPSTPERSPDPKPYEDRERKYSAWWSGSRRAEDWQGLTEDKVGETPQPLCQTETSPQTRISAMATPETLIACFQPVSPLTMYRWMPKLDHIEPQVKIIVDALTALSISKRGDVAAVALETHAQSTCTIYIAASDKDNSLESHFQILWDCLRRVALSTGGASPSLDSPAIDVGVEVYNFVWTAFYDRFSKNAESFVTDFISQVTDPMFGAKISEKERRDLQTAENLFDTLRKIVTPTNPANADMKKIVATLGLLNATLKPYLDFLPPNALVRRCCDSLENVSTTFVWLYLDDVLDLQPPIEVLLDTARSAITRSWFTQSLRVIQVPNAHLPFEVDMHDAVLRLWKDHKGIENPDADLDAQWNSHIIDPILDMVDSSKWENVSIVSTGGRVILSASVRPHSVCALVVHLANSADASPFSYIGLSFNHPCYACYMFLSAYNQSNSRVPFYTLGPKSGFSSLSFSLHSPTTTSWWRMIYG